MSEPIHSPSVGGDVPAPAALPPPYTPVQKRPTRITLQRLISGICAGIAIAALLLTALQKPDEIPSRGLWQYLGEELLSAGNETKTLGDRISEATFGSGTPLLAEKSDLPASLQMPSILPRIYYIPREQILDDIYLERAALEKKIFALYSFDYTKVPADAYPILPSDQSATGATVLKNDTAFSVDMQEISKSAELRAAEVIPSEPLVLIVHTHGTESFSAEGSYCYNEDFNRPRSEDMSQNVVAVGKTLCEALNKRGIPTLHCETLHDKESYINAYTRSAESITAYLAKYPSIRYVFDVHRDSIIRSDLTKLRPVTLWKGEPCAQIMMIVGSDEKGAGEYDWQSNLVLAEAIQQRLFSDTLSIARPLYLRGASYNQQYSRYGLLLEIGSCGNSLSEANRAALAFAEAFSKVLSGD